MTKTYQYRKICILCKKIFHSEHNRTVCPDCEVGKNKMKTEKIKQVIKPKISIMTNDERQERLTFLKTKIIQLKKESFETMYKYIMEFYQIKLMEDAGYTYRKLALDVDMSAGSVYRIMSYRYASIYVKTQTERGVVAPSKVCRLLAHQRGRAEQDNMVKEVIEKDLTFDEMEKKLIRGDWQEDRGIAKKVEFDNSHNLFRDIIQQCERLSNSLEHSDNLSDSYVEKTLTKLEELKLKLLTVIRKFKKKLK